MVGKNSGGTPWYVLNAPEIGGAFQKVEQLIQENGVLEAKTNSLLRLALTAVCRDAVGTEASLQQAIAQGATREEITEVFLMAGAQCAQAQLTWAEEIGQPYLQGSE